MKEFIHFYDQTVNELKAGKVVIPDFVLVAKKICAANLVPNHYLIVRCRALQWRMRMQKHLSK